MLGGIGRSVLDVATFDDAISAAPSSRSEHDRSLAVAACCEPQRLRIAISLKPAIPGVKPSPESIAAIEEITGLLQSLGHVIETHELAHPQLLTTFTPRWAAGIRDDTLAHGDNLERRTRQMATVGRWLSGRALRRSLKRESTVAQRVNAVFDVYDLVMTPVTAASPPSAEISSATGALRSFNQGSPYVCYTPTWNYVGQPAAAIPAGFDSDGLPRAIQLAGPPNSETTIISLAAQIEAATPWRRQRPASVTGIH